MGNMMLREPQLRTSIARFSDKHRDMKTRVIEQNGKDFPKEKRNHMDHIFNNLAVILGFPFNGEHKGETIETPEENVKKYAESARHLNIYCRLLRDFRFFREGELLHRGCFPDLAEKFTSNSAEYIKAAEARIALLYAEYEKKD